MLKKRLIIVLLIVLVLVASGCGKKNSQDSNSNTNLDQESGTVVSTNSDVSNTSETDTSADTSEGNTGDSTEVVTEPTKDVYKPGPFSGKMTKEIQLPRPVIVMVENAPAARPQSGLEDASIVYEYLVEGGITRFAALYYEKLPERVGPVRSTRPYFIDLALEYNALLLHAGASPEGFSMLATRGVDHIDELSNGEYFWRLSTRRAPHNLYTGLNRVLEIFDVKPENNNIVEPHFSFQGIGFINTAEASPATEVKIYYWGGYTVSYKFEENQGNYLRFIDGLPHLMEGGKKLFAYNILIQYVDTKVEDEEGRLSMKTEGSNKALLIKDGYVYTGRWIKDESGITRFVNNSGTEWTINPGQTWVQVVPETVKVEYN